MSSHDEHVRALVDTAPELPADAVDLLRRLGAPAVSWDELQQRLAHCDDCGCEHAAPRASCRCVCHGD